MKGQILDYSIQTNSGVISTTDGTRYNFVGSEWKGDTPPARGAAVDFEVRNGNAVAVYKALGGGGAPAIPGRKDKTTAGLLAIFLGGLGIHKFYLGFTGPGLVFLLTNTIGWLITWILLWTPNMALGVIALIEGIIYLTKTDEEFEQTYVVGKKRGQKAVVLGWEHRPGYIGGRIASQSQPARKQRPPIGVIAPSHLMFVRASR